ncbi:hypothetical protein E2C01_011339 [Portunus trituberculatus]|uniref:Epidermal growth factor-like domain-containing protein n=2 Tax=Portunus trituberculatus TaxID=210409 RepID=A0A5B7DB48_PORTR|nr:hypothetical protein [Portunus trituberculatus]
MSGALRWSAVVVMMAAAALCGATSQDIQLRRGQMGQTMDVAAQGAGVRPGMRLYRGLQVLGEDGRLMTREERRRLRVERRQARKERRRQKHDGRREEAEAVADEPEEVVDLVWLRANLSSLWEEFRAFTRLQDRPLDGRGNSQRGYTNPPEEVQVPLCTPEVDGCRDSEDGEICSNHGTCHCGHCQCQSEYYGRTCQCSDHTCQL